MRPGRSAPLLAIALAGALLASACSTGARSGLPEAPVVVRDSTPRPAGEEPPPWSIDEVAPAPEVSLDVGQPVRIALARGDRRVAISGTGEWRLYDTGGESTLLRASEGEVWAVEARGGALRAVGDDGTVMALRPAPFVARPAMKGSYITVNGKSYRGEVWLFADGEGVTAVNRLALENYLRGVVPLEIGNRAESERAAVEAQAVAARSYAYTHLAPGDTRLYDMVATVMDQVYGGVRAETPISDAAVAATVGLVLTYHGVVVNAPYHSTCGGTTSRASEVWLRSGDEPYLVPVSDRIPGTDRYYCDISPRFRWTRNFTEHALRSVLDRYLRNYASVPRGGAGRPLSVKVASRTPTGRVRDLVITTDRGRFTLRENDIRFVLRSSSGEILNSTYFSVEEKRDGGARGALRSLVVSGSGYGHGIGMCQWGAIGRARAGQDFRQILRTYYPGTVVTMMAGD
ncbi:MAG TPA: SpoIID/LytB domain-containing protein [Gemmatimonadaceae bacterium]|nr:SpoIID/LytB domain-containing protein [Gemmatimonadaceae bacterium]